jgi:chromosomal replication initiation ATPase DnaA
MYLTHVGFALSLQRVGVAFDRDRATVAHACNRVEAWREEDPAFDALIAGLEHCIRAAPARSFP